MTSRNRVSSTQFDWSTDSSPFLCQVAKQIGWKTTADCSEQVAAGLAGSNWLEAAPILQLFWQAQTFLAEQWRFPDLQKHFTVGEWRFPDLQKHSTVGEWHFPDLQKHSTVGEWKSNELPESLPGLAKPSKPWLSEVFVHNR